MPCIRGLSINVNSWSIHDQYRLDAQAQARCNRRLQLTLSPPSPCLLPDFTRTSPHLTAVWLALAGQGSKLHPIIIIGYNIGYNMFLPSSLLLLLRLFRDWELRLIRQFLLDSEQNIRWSRSIHTFRVIEGWCIRGGRGGRWQKGHDGTRWHTMARNQHRTTRSIGRTIEKNCERFFEQMILDDRFLMTDGGRSYPPILWLIVYDCFFGFFGLPPTLWGLSMGRNRFFGGYNW